MGKRATKQKSPKVGHQIAAQKSSVERQAASSSSAAAAKDEAKAKAHKACSISVKKNKIIKLHFKWDHYFTHVRVIDDQTLDQRLEQEYAALSDGEQLSSALWAEIKETYHPPATVVAKFVPTNPADINILIY